LGNSNIHPVLKSFKNVMRSDDGSYFYGNIDFDLMKQHQYVFSLIAKDVEAVHRNYERLFHS
jgi:hypothetical protein